MLSKRLQGKVAVGTDSGIGRGCALMFARHGAGVVGCDINAAAAQDAVDQARREDLRATLPIGRVVGPADVAALAVHIMINTALTGATYDIDGGQQFVTR